MSFEIGLDLFPLTAGVLTAIACGLLGNFLVLRRLSLMGDAISHSVLPGLVIAFLISGTRNTGVMFLGAALAGIVTVVLVEVVKRLGRVEPGAAMGVVFSVLFAIGVLLIRQAASLENVDIDADCVLHGQLEGLLWYGAPESITGLWSMDTLRAVPQTIWTLLGVCVASALFVVALFKELRIAAFDPELATTQGFHAGLLHYTLMIVVAGATVAAFEAVGSILVIAMLICPAATARMLTDRLSHQIWVTLAVSVLAGIGGYFAASWVPGVIGLEDVPDVNAAGSITVAAGGLLGIAVVFGPRHGALARSIRRKRIASSLAMDDVLGALYRFAENEQTEVLNETLHEIIKSPHVEQACRRAAKRGHILRDGNTISLTTSGREHAKRLIRQHRQWESYLVDEAGLASDHVHDSADRFEHLQVAPTLDVQTDPHGRRIPMAEDPDEQK